MATRMQQRRGTAAQWTAANPTLAAGEIGFETDNNRFKIGDGATAWGDLDYFANSAALESLLDGAPDALNTLNELAAALGDDASFSTTVNNAINSAITTSVEYTDAKVDLYIADTTNVHGIADTSALATHTQVATAKSEAITAATGQSGEALSDHNNSTSNIHGIADTTLLVTTTGTQTLTNKTITAPLGLYKEDVGLDNVDNTSDINKPISAATQDALDLKAPINSPDLTGVPTAPTALEATNTTQIATTAFVHSVETSTQGYADTAVSDHNAETLNIHGIADTSLLATTEYADGAASGAGMSAQTYAEGFVGNAIAALTKSSVGLANVDNTSDANKPTSTATQTALDLKANLAGATFTGDVTVETNLIIDGNLTVTGTTTTVDTADLVVTDPMIYMGEGNTANLADLGFVASYNDGTYQHAGLVRDSSANTWKLFKGVTDEPTTTVNFAQGSLDALSVGALAATTVTPSSGIVFSDGTQTKVGVPSITTFATAISSSATLAAGEQDKFVPLTGAVTITLPATGYSTGQSIDFYQASGTGAQFASTNSVVGTPGLKFRTTNSVVTAMKTSSGWLVFGDLSA